MRHQHRSLAARAVEQSGAEVDLGPARLGNIWGEILGEEMRCGDLQGALILGQARIAIGKDPAHEQVYRPGESDAELVEQRGSIGGQVEADRDRITGQESLQTVWDSTKTEKVEDEDMSIRGGEQDEACLSLWCGSGGLLLAALAIGGSG